MRGVHVGCGVGDGRVASSTQERVEPHQVHETQEFSDATTTFHSARLAAADLLRQRDRHARGNGTLTYLLTSHAHQVQLVHSLTQSDHHVRRLACSP